MRYYTSGPGFNSRWRPNIFNSVLFKNACERERIHLIIYILSQGGWIYLDGVTYPNNSIVNLLEIGTHNTSLHCYTNLTVCCRSSDDPESRSKGFWRFPNGSHVGSLVDSTPEMFSRTRGLSTVILHRGRLASDSGIFTCEVPDSNLNTQSLFIGIYPLNKGNSYNYYITNWHHSLIN